jgi:hypothetical protein
MRVETHNNLSGGTSSPATRVVVYDDYDNPVCVCMKIQGGRITCVRVGDKRFHEALQMLGIRKTVIVDSIDPSKLPRLELK